MLSPHNAQDDIGVKAALGLHGSSFQGLMFAPGTWKNQNKQYR